MALSPWDPFREFDRMERLFRRTFEGRRGESLPSPAIEVTDEGDHYQVRAEIPGVAEEDVDITLTGNVLSIRGEKKYERRETAPSTQTQEGQTQGGNAPGGGQQAEKSAGLGATAQQTADTGKHTEITKTEEKTELARPMYSEVYYGSFERTLTLPDDIDADKVDARYKDGVFFIEIGKKEQHRAKRINITRH